MVSSIGSRRAVYELTIFHCCFVLYKFCLNRFVLEKTLKCRSPSMVTQIRSCRVSPSIGWLVRNIFEMYDFDSSAPANPSVMGQGSKRPC